MSDASQLIIVGLGGTLSPNSSSERALLFALGNARARGAKTSFLRGSDLVFPMYEPDTATLNAERPGKQLIDLLRSADGIIVSSPCYHGSPSGLIKNAIDYTEEMRSDDRPYFEGRAVGCIGCGLGWQGPNSVLIALRSIIHSLRGWPTPQGVAINTKLVSFSNDACSDPSVENQINIMVDQIIRFAKAMKFKPPGGVQTSDGRVGQEATPE